VSDHEKALLGLCLLSPEHFGTVVDSLPPDLWSPENRPIYVAMKTLYEMGESVDLVTLKNHLVKTGTLMVSGGEVRIAALTDGIPIVSLQAAKSWVAAVAEAGKRRRIVSGVTGAARLCSDTSLNSEALLSRFQAIAFEIASGIENGTSSTPKDLARQVREETERIQASKDGIIGIPSGLFQLDKMTHGFEAGQYVILAARPSVGKSSLAIQVASHAAKLGNTTVFFSYEMQSSKVAMVRAKMESSLSEFEIRISREGAIERLTSTVSFLAETPFFLEKPRTREIGPMRARCARIKARHGLDMIVVDYAQLMTGPGATLYERITNVSAALKGLAEEMEVPILVCAQLNRDADGERPHMSQLKESGSLEQDADMVMLLHRDFKDCDRSQPINMTLILEKNRYGETGEIPLIFEGKHHRFKEPGE
jgi:replicative DNA helicase